MLLATRIFRDRYSCVCDVLRAATVHHICVFINKTNPCHHVRFHERHDSFVLTSIAITLSLCLWRNRRYRRRHPTYLSAEWSRSATCFCPSSNHRPFGNTTALLQHAFSEAGIRCCRTSGWRASATGSTWRVSSVLRIFRDSCRLRQRCLWLSINRTRTSCARSTKYRWQYALPRSQVIIITSCRRGSVAEWLACWTQAQKGPGSNCSRYAVG